jgi:hypothetical protein
MLKAFKEPTHLVGSTQRINEAGFFDIDTLCNTHKKISKTLPTGYEKGKNQPTLVWTP